MIKLIFLILSISSCVFANQIAIIEKYHNLTETSDKCIELSRHRLDLSECCKYPQIHYRKFMQGNCIDECLGSRDICCSLGCIWRSSNVIDEHNQIDHHNLKQTLKKAIAHDEHWNELIDEVVDECLVEVEESIMKFCKFPWHITKVLGCTTRKLFLQCPKMRHIPECKLTRQYVEECM